jgi:hypothetical protein
MMAWKDLLSRPDESVVAPWLGGRSLRIRSRAWTLDGALPREVGWYRFALAGRRATAAGKADVQLEALRHDVRGYLVGDRLVSDGVRVSDPSALAGEPVALLDPGLGRFTRVVAGRCFELGPLVFKSQDFPLGPEEAVLQAYYDRRESLDGVSGVTPALDAAFRLESWTRGETERRRAELARLRAEEEARLEREERARQLGEQLGTGAGRRAMAAVDFAEAARAALALGGAEYLDHHEGYYGEMVVTYRLLRRQFTCTCDKRTLRILNAGVCLTNHATGFRGDTLFTLESIAGVILQAERERKLVVTWHGDDGEDRDDYDD